MRLLKVAALSLLQLTAVFAAETFTLDQVEDQIDAFLKQNGTLEARSYLPSGCEIACGFLRFTKSSQVAFPDTPAYDLQESGYWSQQQASTEPSCRFTPNTAEDVSLAVLALRVTNCKFAVKSGGHAAFSGASNIEDGLTIDLGKLNKISLSSDNSQASIGAGSVWFDVYSYLTPKGLTVIGGRVSAIGVGGLTLGGGISFFSNRYGWACDNVNKYQVVFADGTIREVTYKSQYSDLYWALRGGGNNFGIVTRFDVPTYPQGDLWAGASAYIYSPETAKAINDAVYNLAMNSPADPYAQVIIAYAYAQSLDTFVIASDLQYGKPTPNPPILKNFTSITGAVSSTLRITNLPDLTREFNDTNPNGFRQSYWTFTFKNSAEVMAKSVEIYMEEVNKIKDAADIVPSIVYQPIPTEMIQHFSKNGGNPLGLAGSGPLNIVNIAISWSNAADDQRILAAAQNMVDKAVAFAKTKGLDHPFLYQNYASQQQKVFPSYGQSNLAKLKSISSKYDPQQVWQKLQPGYFKL